MGRETVIPIMPASGLMDTRSTPDEVPFGGYRYIQNIEVTQKKRMCRTTGWHRFRDRDDYNNQDLHDQLVGNTLLLNGTKLPGRQPIQLLFRAESEGGFSKLFAATQSRIYALDNAIGNWKIIAGRLATYGGTPESECSEVIWTADSIDQTVVFSNGFDTPLAHTIDQPSHGIADESVHLIDDFSEEKLNVTKVGHVIAWKNFMFYMNVEQDGRQFTNRIIWSDYKRPLSCVPDSVDSLAGRHDLPSNETILAAAPMADLLLIYTTKGVWQFAVTGGPDTFSISNRYTHETGNRCLAYRRTLVTTGDEHYFMGRDGIYAYNLFIPKPDLVEWVHKASSLIFDDLNVSKCNAHVGGYFAERKQLWFSWARDGEDCPTQTFIIGTEYPFTSVLDHGFTAFLNYRPFEMQSLREFLKTYCVCTEAELDTYGGNFGDDEGGFCNDVPDPDPSCPVRPTSLYSLAALDIGDEKTVEDYTGPADANSFHTLYNSLTVAELCRDEWRSAECDAVYYWLMASSEDQCIKEARDIATVRRMCTNSSFCGSYKDVGYKSRLLSGPLAFSVPESEKIIKKFAMEMHVAAKGSCTLNIGASVQALDPLENDATCNIHWLTQPARAIDCLQGGMTLAQFNQKKVAPYETFTWGIWGRGKYFYFDIIIDNPTGVPVDTGVAVCISRISMTVARMDT